MRVAETRAVNRALRKAYGIGICSVDEIGARAEPQEPTKMPPQPTNGNANGRTVRDRLCQIIRQYHLDANLVKTYATDSCGVKTLRDATRAQVEDFVTRLADWAEKDLNALRCQLNSYLGGKRMCTPGGHMHQHSIAFPSRRHFLLGVIPGQPVGPQ